MTSDVAHPTGFRFAAALSTREIAAAAADEVVVEVGAALGGPPDVALLFASIRHGPDFKPILEQIHDRLGPRTLVGCTGESIVGNDREIEEEPALALWAARLPGVEIESAHLSVAAAAGGPRFAGWPEGWRDSATPATLVALCDPFTLQPDDFAHWLSTEHPGVTLVGGMASGGGMPGESQLFLGQRAVDSGAVVMLLRGPLRVRALVSQGCRPIGRPYVITKAKRNVVFELGGRRAYEVLVELYESLPPDQQEQLRHGLHLGRVINEYQDTFQRGDFLVRNVLGADPREGAIAIADVARVGQTVQFHLRDAASADDDLREALTAVPESPAPRGALLFTCNGRGTRLFDAPHHDAGAIRQALGGVPLAGFFAQGEFGPVGGKNFVHGYTASLAVFEPPS